MVSKKTHFDSKPPTHLGTLFRDIRVFLTFIFHRFFGCSLIPNFKNFGAERVAKRRFPESLFGGISRSVAKVRIKLPFGRQHRFRGFRAPKKRKISTLFSEEVRGSSGIAVFRAFDVFGCRSSKSAPFFADSAVFFRFYMKKSVLKLRLEK